MKILMLSTDSQIFDEKSAVRQRILEYGKLVEELHVVVYTNNARQTTDNERQVKIAANVFLYPTNSRWKFSYFFDAYRISKSLVVSRKLSLVTAQDPFETGLVGYWLKKKFGVSLQIQIHTDFLSPYFIRASIKNRLRSWFGFQLLKKADGIRVVSERIKKSLLSRGVPEEKISVLPIFVDIQEIRNKMAQSSPRWTDGRPTILTVSRLAPEKNLSLAIEAVGEVVKKYPKLRYAIVGAGVEDQNLKLKIKNLKLENNITIEPWADDLAAYYKSADIFLLTSNYEGYGMAPIEAAAAGLPVIMTDVGIAIGSVVPVGDKSSLIRVLDELLGSKNKRDQIVAEQNKLFQNWPTKADYLNKMKELWQKCFS